MRILSTLGLTERTCERVSDSVRIPNHPYAMWPRRSSTLPGAWPSRKNRADMNNTRTTWTGEPYDHLRMQAAEQLESVSHLVDGLEVLLGERERLLAAVRSTQEHAGMSPLAWRDLLQLWDLAEMRQTNDRLSELVERLQDALVS